jgi:hypothetical protein
MARKLRADVPRVEADDRFIVVLADLAASSTPAAAHSRVGKTALRVKIVAVAACVALVSVGAAYGDQFGDDGRAPVGPTDTVDPASPGEPDERFEENDEDLAPHDLNEGRETHPNGGAGNGVPNDTGLPDSGVEFSRPEAPAPQGQAGQAGAEQDQTDPKASDSQGGDSQGSPASDDSTDPAHDSTDPAHDSTDPAHDSSGPADDADPRPDVDPRPDADPDDPDTDAEASDADPDADPDDPDAARDSGPEVND